MHLTGLEKRLLSLNPREEQVLRALQKLHQAPIHILAAHLSIPRTSLYWPLNRLHERSLVGYELHGKRKHWHSKIASSPIRRLGSLESGAGDVRTCEGADQMRDLLNHTLELHPDERILILEGNLAASSIEQKVGVDFMIDWHQQAHKRNIIIESIIGESVYNNLTKQLLGSKILRSLAQLDMWIGYVVPDEWMGNDATLILFRNSAILIDWSSVRGTVIHAPEIVTLLHSFCSVFQLIGRKIDIVSHVRSIVTSAN